MSLAKHRKIETRTEPENGRLDTVKCSLPWPWENSNGIPEVPFSFWPYTIRGEIAPNLVVVANFILMNMDVAYWLCMFPEPATAWLLLKTCKSFLVPKMTSMYVVIEPLTRYDMMLKTIVDASEVGRVTGLVWKNATIPREEESEYVNMIKMFTELTRFDINNNNLWFGVLNRMSDILSQYTTLVYLDLSHQGELPSNAWDHYKVSNQLMKLTNLTHLGLAGWSLAPTFSPDFNGWLAKCTGLTTLNLRGTLVSTYHWTFFQALTSVTDLDISCCQISNGEICSWTKLSMCTNLVSLNLETNCIGDIAVPYLVTQLQPISTLKCLNVTYNVFSPAAIQGLRQELTTVWVVSKQQNSPVVLRIK